MDTPDKLGLKNTQVIQLIHIILEGEDKKGEKVQILLDSNRRILPMPYTEEP